MDGVIQFSGLKFTREEGNGSEAMAKILLQHCSRSLITGICFHHKVPLKVWHSQNISTAQGVAELLKGSLLGRSPYKRGLLTGQVGKWSGDGGEVADELIVIISQAQKLLDFFLASGYWPLLYGGNFGGIHGNTTGRNTVSKVLDL